MDLFAYSQIDDFDHLLKDNNIEIPRLRGVRLMSQEKPEHDYIPKDLEYGILRDWVACDFGRDKYFYTYSSWANKVVDQLSYAAYEDDEYGEVRKINWKLLKRKDKKYLKLQIKHRIKEYSEQFETFNKYCGRDDVLYIHARIGGSNWAYYDGPELTKQPWFIEKVDDAFDSTYCDIYAKIEPLKVS